MGKEWKQWKQCLTLFFWAPKSLRMVIAAMKLSVLKIDKQKCGLKGYGLRERDSGGVDGCEIHLSSQIRQEYNLRLRQKVVGLDAMILVF